MIGTMILVLTGCGSIVFAGNMPGTVSTGAGALEVAMAFGLSVVALAYVFGGISGCHINPAITLGVYCSGRMGGKDALLYMIFQVIGGFSGQPYFSYWFPLVHMPVSLWQQATASARARCYRPLSPRLYSRLFLFSWRWEPRIKRKGPVNWQVWSSG